MEQEATSKENKQTKKGTSFMKNVLILMFAQIMVKVLGLIYKFVITNFEGFGDTGLGYYSAGYQIYSVLLALSSIGIPSVISKLVSERMAIGDQKGAQRIFRICMTFFVGLGTAFSIVLFFGAEYIATAIFNVPDTKYVMQVLAPAIAFVAASATFRGYFAGLNDMKPTSSSQIIEQFLNCVLSITFVYALIGREPYIMAAGGNLSSTLAIIITFMYLIIYYKNKTDLNIEKIESNEFYDIKIDYDKTGIAALDENVSKFVRDKRKQFVDIVDKSGKVEWAKTAAGEISAQSTNDGGFIISGPLTGIRIQIGDYILENIDLGNAKFYNEYNYGSYMIYRGIPVFIDSRADLYAPEFSGKDDDIFMDFIETSSLGVFYEDTFEKYGITHVITYKNSKMNMIIKDTKDPNYIELYEDKYFTIYQRVNV